MCFKRKEDSAALSVQSYQFCYLLTIMVELVERSNQGSLFFLHINLSAGIICFIVTHCCT